METFGLQEGEELEHPWLNRSVETAQKRVEQRNYMMRKRTLEFDDVMNQQREVVYGYRNEVMDAENPRELILEVINEVVPKKISPFLESAEGEEPDHDALLHWINTTFPLGLTKEKAALHTRSVEENANFLIETIRDAYERKASLENPDALRGLERYIILNAIDRLWQEHLYAMDSLRSHIGLRAYGQRDPLIEYKAEAFKLFDELMINIKSETCSNIFRSASSLMAFEQFLHSLPQVTIHQTASAFSEAAAQEQAAASGPGSEMVTEANEALAKAQPMRSNTPRVGRNDPCPCGSGKKFKSCHGR
jgi:preprotein translocase subunit SecA